MMNSSDEILDFAELGKTLRALTHEQIKALHAEAGMRNPWFTFDNVKRALEAIGEMLDEKVLIAWASRYTRKNKSAQRIGVVMAGNIPLVGFHDFLCVLVSGHILMAKLSSDDEVLMKHIFSMLCKINPKYNERVFFVERLKDIHAVIATGSNNTARYFEYYFSKYPHIIRKSRTSVAVLMGDETEQDMKALAEDVFSYFGLGCRNVSKIFVPESYPLGRMVSAFQHYSDIINHTKYANNYEYNKAIYMLKPVLHLDAGFFLLTESEQLFSPIAVVYYQKYRNMDELKKHLDSIKNNLQCVVCKHKIIDTAVPPGKAQRPTLYDYADGINTMEFLHVL
ncbi:MAG: acyl-CoA reductase [Cytophagaceae bacterium]|nr:acyl-CoA reductase [Cytophagaceae bacterium]MDW8456109.1 acyl-CoA reductase [Cytophagaceae bacterium]